MNDKGREYYEKHYGGEEPIGSWQDEPQPEEAHEKPWRWPFIEMLVTVSVAMWLLAFLVYN